jgi:hypothetical protein
MRILMAKETPHISRVKGSFPFLSPKSTAFVSQKQDNMEVLQPAAHRNFKD